MSTEAKQLPRVRRVQPRRKASGTRARLQTLADLDRRTAAAKAAFELRDAIIADLGGENHVSAMKLAVVESAATLGAMLEDMAVTYLKGQPADLALYGTLANSQRRLLADLGLERRMQNVTPDLRDYVHSKAQEPV